MVVRRDRSLSVGGEPGAGWGTTERAHDLQPKLVRRKLYRAHGTLCIRKHRTLDPARSRTVGRCGCSVRLWLVGVLCRNLFPYLHRPVE